MLKKTTLLTLIIIFLEFSHSMLNSLLGIPRYNVLKNLSVSMYGDKSLLMTRLEIITGAIAFVVSLFFVLSKLKKENALRYKVILLLLPIVGAIASAVTVSILIDFQDVLTAPWVYTVAIVPSITGESFLFETCMSDIVALIVKDKQQRVSLFLWVKGGKLAGICFTQIVLPLLKVGEDDMLEIATPVVCIMLSVTGVLLTSVVVFVPEDETTVVQITAPTPTPSIELQQRINDSEFQQNLEEITYVIDDDYIIKEEEPSELSSNIKLLWEFVKSLNRYHVVLCSLIMFHSAQRGEYKFTYLFLANNLNFEPRHLRIINGCQYLLFTVSVYVMGFVIRHTSHTHITLIAFIVSMLFSTAARVCQIVSWDLNNFIVWCASALLSTPGPLAYQVMQQVMYKKLYNEQLVGIILLSVDKFVSIPIIQLYQIAYQQLQISPFYVTLMLMLLTTVGGLSTKTMRTWLNS
ncbi:ORF24 [Spodoptera eridania nucleopolyhedrovirus]|uniref:ORF24 n=1 Tax=Spodoptera eridania nucleopolyhedrovirus TaxID=2315721 RepID=A0A346TPW2_9ABAC|nr:ORF24 [Spodoptera eridania nucleopolyhedrovirus]AXU41622.1 ORF24 [Spodoptera eridania nucleopolyhedrovirus]